MAGIPICSTGIARASTQALPAGLQRRGAHAIRD
jgi:hypothetical protein